MPRSICYCEPSHAFAGEKKNWNFIYIPAATLPKGTGLKFDPQSKGRTIDWEIPSVDLKGDSGVIYAVMGNKKLLPAREVFPADQLCPQYEFILPSALNAGEEFKIVIGSKEEDPSKQEDGAIRAQTIAQRRRSFLLFVGAPGKTQYGEPEVFSMDVRGGKLEHIRVLAHSFVAKNKRFDLIVRFEDKYGNLTNHAPSDTVVELSHEHLRENLKWRLFVPETGFITLPNLYFNEEGVYTIVLKNPATDQLFRSPPIKCFPDNNKHLFWGLLHGESERFDATENIESCLRHFRDDKAYNFYAVSPFENQEETPNDMWKLITQNVADFNEDERFSSLLGFQWQGDNKTEGLRLFVHPKDNKALLRKKDPKYSSLKKIYKSLSPKELISIPSFTMGKGSEFNFDHYDPDFERVVEIYNAWGSSEMSKKEGNPRPISTLDGKGIQESAEGSIQKALLRNCRFGFVAGGLDDRGLYGELYDSDQIQYSPGLTAIIAPTYSREALIEALYQRSCYATTGERIIVGLSLAGVSMGKETSTADKPGLTVNRHLSGYVAGSCNLKSIEVIRNGEVIHTFYPKTYFLDFTYDDMVPLETVAIEGGSGKPRFIYYYLRATQEDGHMAWGSPIWVDYIPLASLSKIPVKRVPSKTTSTKTPLAIQEIFAETGDDEEEEEDEE